MAAKGPTVTDDHVDMGTGARVEVGATLLATRLAQPNFIRAVECMLGAQAQVMSAAELSIGARVDGLKRADVQRALWQDRTLVKTWAMRGTIHLLAAEDLPLVVAARCANGGRHRLHDFLQLGFTEAQYDEFLLAVPEVLGDEPVSREVLANAVAERMKTPEISKALLGSSWGTLWKPSMFRGELCFGPSEGRTNTFVNPRKWLKEWKEWEPKEAQQELTRRYLRTYGPATPGRVQLLVGRRRKNLREEDVRVRWRMKWKQ